MKFEIDVSGEDIFNKNYVICVADNNGLIKGFKVNSKFSLIIHSRYGQNMYRYRKSRKGKANLKIRLYCVIIYHLFKSLNLRNNELN